MCQLELKLELKLKEWCYINVKLVPNAYIKQISHEHNELSWFSQPYKITTVNNNNNNLLVWFINCYAKNKNKNKDCAYSNIAVNKERTMRKERKCMISKYRWHTGVVNVLNKQHSEQLIMNSKMHESSHPRIFSENVYIVHCYSVTKRPSHNVNHHIELFLQIGHWLRKIFTNIFFFLFFSLRNCIRCQLFHRKHKVLDSFIVSNDINMMGIRHISIR